MNLVNMLSKFLISIEREFNKNNHILYGGKKTTQEHVCLT